MFKDLRRIFSLAQIREVLTHSSFYEKEGKGNSRFVFAGMFVFKGQVAEVLYKKGKFTTATLTLLIVYRVSISRP